MIALSAAMAVSACVPAAGVITKPAAEAERPAVWVDSFASPGGDGSSERPLKSVPAALPPRAHLHLKTGVYPGPFTFAGVLVEGHGQVVLTAEAGETTVTAGDGTLLRTLSIQGGELGLAVLGRVTASQLHLSGQRRRGARVDGELVLSDSEAVGSVEGVDGFGGAGTFRFERVKLEGLRRGVWCEGGVLAVSGLSALGVKAPVFATQCSGEVRAVTAEAGSGPAVAVSGGSLNVLGLTVRAQEYGLLLSSGAKVSATQLDVQRTEQACVSAVQSELTLSASDLSACGMGGAVLLFDSSGVLSGLEVHDTRDLGVLVRHGALAVTASRFARITASGDALGDALHVRESKAIIKAVRVTDVAGSALFATAFAEVKVPSLEVERAKQPALFVERGAKVEVESLLVRGGGGAVLVPDRAKVTIRSLSVAGGSDLPIYAECDEGAEVQLGRLESTVQQLKSRCVTPLP